MLELLTGKHLKDTRVQYFSLLYTNKLSNTLKRMKYVLFLYTEMVFESKYLFPLQEKELAI